MQMKCKCNANEMNCDQMQNKCIILGMIHYGYGWTWMDVQTKNRVLTITLVWQL